ncbi:hypothetical protein CANARDRAFT_7926 [[Candida] arabinofermentans NRRL YB-2248]|uniref:Uncharacterized protein n=1 Tax=[Candida] arabinofermentans NRRL YB-2248 TaxID=983967 RepID=A0A1E4T0L9_9ASCO|nr:hypothetical protein CANARDRAFT_7926 [[Candida] arabinofermentans NRRL YB-2248]
MATAVAYHDQSFRDSWYQNIMSHPEFRNSAQLSDTGNTVVTTGTRRYEESIEPIPRNVINLNRSNSSLHRSLSITSSASSRRFEVKRKKAFNKPGYYRIPQQKQQKSNFELKKKNRNKKNELISASYKTERQLNSIFKLMSNENLNQIPEHMISYSIPPPIINQIKWNPTIRYDVKKAVVIYNEVYLNQTNMKLNDYLKTKNDDEKNQNQNRNLNLYNLKSIEDGINKLGLNSKSLKYVPIQNYKLSSSKNRLSTMAEISLASSNEHYNEIKRKIFSLNLKNFNQLNSYLRTLVDYNENEYVLNRLLFEIYLRRIVSARLAIKLSVDQSRKRQKNQWDKLSDLVSSVYGIEQTKFFKEQ